MVQRRSIITINVAQFKVKMMRIERGGCGFDNFTLMEFEAMREGKGQRMGKKLKKAKRKKTK